MFVNEFAGDHQTTVTLLHVVNGRATEGNLVESCSRVAEKHLERLARKLIDPCLSPRLCIRIGKPVQEILAEVKQSNVDLVVLTRYGASSVRKRLFRPRLAEKVLSAAPCNVSLLHVETRFNCEKQWEPVDNVVTALEYVGLLKPVNPWTSAAT